MVSTTVDQIARTADGVPLKVKLQRTERRRKLKAVGLVLPLFLFIVVAFIVPIGVMLFNAVHDDVLKSMLPETEKALAGWDGKDLPDEAVYAALVQDLKAAWKQHDAPEIGQRLNYEMPGARSEVIISARKATKLTTGPYKQAMIDIDPLWSQM